MTRIARPATIMTILGGAALLFMLSQPFAQVVAVHPIAVHHSSTMTPRRNKKTSIHTHAILDIRGGATRRQPRTTKRAAVKSTKNTDTGATILSSVFNLVNNVAGAGILTLSSGMIGTGWIPALLICALLGLLSAHCFAIVGQACELTKETSFKGLWKTTIGQQSAWMVDAIIAVMCVACCIIYSGILGDVFTPLLAQAGVPSQFNGRTSNSEWYL